MFFENGQATVQLSPENERELHWAIRGYRHSGARRIGIVGHTDRAGMPEQNMKLSIRRAQAVKAELIRRGIAENANSIIGRGETQPLAPTPDGVRERLNRRVEIAY